MVMTANSFVEKLSMLVWAEKSFLENENMRGGERKTFKMLKLIGDAATIPLDHCKTHKEKLEKGERQQEEQSKTKTKSTVPGGTQQKRTKRKH